MNKKLLLPFEKYSTNHEVPYFYTIESSDQVLHYFGAEHSRDVSHPQFEILQEKWQGFLDKTKDKKSIVFFEGNKVANQPTTLEESIERLGVSGAIVFFANQSDIPSHRPEPTIKEEVDGLLKKFSKEQIFYFYTCRMIGFWQSGIFKKFKDFNHFIDFQIGRYKKALDWKSFDFSFESFKKIHTETFDYELDLNDNDVFRRITSPINYEGVFNEIARESSTVRNLFILDQIEEKWREGYNIFIVYGAGHAVMQEDVIKSLA